MARPEGKDRGLFERPKDSGVWCMFLEEDEAIKEASKLAERFDNATFLQGVKHWRNNWK